MTGAQNNVKLPTEQTSPADEDHVMWSEVLEQVRLHAPPPSVLRLLSSSLQAGDGHCILVFPGITPPKVC